MLLNQQPGNGHAVRVVGTGGVVQRSPAGAVGLGPFLQEALDKIQPPFDAGQHQRRFALGIGFIHIQLGAQQQGIGHPPRLQPQGFDQGGLALGINGVGVHAAQQQIDDRPVVVAHDGGLKVFQSPTVGRQRRQRQPQRTAQHQGPPPHHAPPPCVTHGKRRSKLRLVSAAMSSTAIPRSWARHWAT